MFKKKQEYNTDDFCNTINSMIHGIESEIDTVIYYIKTAIKAVELIDIELRVSTPTKTYTLCEWLEESIKTLESIKK
ncbi:MAG: hypothetical protein WCE94_00670 [Candidatus Methanoperedens sp.]